MIVFRQAGLVCALVLLGLCTVAQAATVAYWRFEDKNGIPAIAGDSLRSFPAGGGNASDGNIVDVSNDSSGNGNVLRVFHSPNDPLSADGVQRLETSPTYTGVTPIAVIPRTGAPNLLAFDFDGAPGSDAPAPADAGGDDIYSRDANNVEGPVDALNLVQYTIEGAFRADTLGRFQSIMVKDGNIGNGGGANGGAGPLPGFNVKLFNDNTLHVETFDGSGAFRSLAADLPMAAEVWYKFAVVNDGATMQLYLDRSNGSGYVLQSAQQPISGGALFNYDQPWAMGRGWFNGPNDAFDGQIDEVRISDVALGRSQLLFSTIPEPKSLLLCFVALVCCAWWRASMSNVHSSDESATRKPDVNFKR